MTAASKLHRRKIADTIGLEYSAVPACRSMAANRASRQGIGELEATAKEQGAAIGVVRRTRDRQAVAGWAGKLEAKGFVLVPVSAAVRSQRPS